MSSGMTRFIKDATIELEEDELHEFKMHSCMSTEEIPAKGNLRTKRAISRNINGFLNSGRGGKIFIGIDDDGVIKGLSLSPAQMEHVRVSLEDVLSRYYPPVTASLYQLDFVLVESGTGGNRSRSETIPSPSRSGSAQDGRKPHQVRRTLGSCWCHRNATAQLRAGVLYPRYVAIVTIKKPTPKRINMGIKDCEFPLRPIYLDEKGLCYFRKSSSVWPCSYDYVVQCMRQEVSDHYKKIISSYQEKIEAVVSSYSNKPHPVPAVPDRLKITELLDFM